MRHRSLGRIGDKRAVPGLRAVLKNGSTDLRKHARKTIARIESNGNGNRYAYENDETNFSEKQVDIPLVTLDIPSDLFKCEYLSRVENGETKTEYGNTARFSNDLMLTDEVRKLAEESRNAANQITLLIKEIQQGTKQAVTTME